MQNGIPVILEALEITLQMFNRTWTFQKEAYLYYCKAFDGIECRDIL